MSPFCPNTVDYNFYCLNTVLTLTMRHIFSPKTERAVLLNTQYWFPVPDANSH